MQFTLTQSITISHLGRYYISNNKASHELNLIRASDNAILGNLTLDLSTGQTDSLGFKYGKLVNNINLSVGTVYYLVTSEVSGGDQWYDDSGTIITSTIGNISNGIYWDGTKWVPTMGTGACYGPLSFQYLS